MNKTYLAAIVRAIGLIMFLTGVYLLGGWIWTLTIWGAIIFTPNHWWFKS